MREREKEERYTDKQTEMEMNGSIKDKDEIIQVKIYQL